VSEKAFNLAGLGEAWQGEAWLGEAGRGEVFLCPHGLLIWQGGARRGQAWLGEARQGFKNPNGLLGKLKNKEDKTAF
jgi:hypothetical protein